MEDSSINAFDLLETALDQAFSVQPPREPPQSEVTPIQDSSDSTNAPNPQPEGGPEPVQAASDPAINLWKSEYEAQVQSWRAQSAEAREKAEQERLKWEAIRAIERQEAAKRKAAGIAEPTPGVLQPKAEVETKSEIWESVAELSTAGSEVTKSEKFGQAASTVSDSFPKVLPRTDSQLETATNESQKWEDVPSVASSFPSMSFPEHIESPPSQPPAAPQRPTGSVTLAIFDSSLSPRTRLTALFSSLAINLFLPFVNGVMLGFGEIFAKNIVMGWFGWKPSGPASTTTNVGLRGSREERQRQSR